jgi:hypothetical protein
MSESLPNIVGDLRRERHFQVRWGGEWMSPTREKRRRWWYRPLLEERMRMIRNERLNPSDGKTQKMEGFSLIAFSRFHCDVSVSLRTAWTLRFLKQWVLPTHFYFQTLFYLWKITGYFFLFYFLFLNVFLVSQSTL